MKYIILILFFLINIFIVNIFAQDKKPVFILYDNGTWEKVNENEAAKPQKSIEDVWKEFQTAIKNNDKSEIISFFRFPLSLECQIIEADPVTFEYKCIRPICNIVGSLSRSKLENSLNIIFDNALKKGILSKKYDEYFEGQSERFGKPNFSYAILIPTKENDEEYIKGKKIIIQKDFIMICRLYFIAEGGELKLYTIAFDRQ